MSDNVQRPKIATVTSGAELRKWYWLKSELQAEARRRNLSQTGSKESITSRLAHYLDTGEKQRATRRKVSSDFNWATAILTPETVITDSYKNGQNVRAFFQAQYGPTFTFNIAFMDWMRANVGRTLGEAVIARREIAEREKTQKPVTPPGNQYNAYARAFHAANPDRSPRDARLCWAWKRARPGHNRYEDSDLLALDAPI